MFGCDDTSSRFGRWLVSLAAAATAVALAAPVSAQDSGSEGSSGSAADDQKSTKTESSGDESGESGSKSKGPTPKLALLPVSGASDDISDIVPDRIAELLRKRLGKVGAVDLLPAYEEIHGGGSASEAVQEARRKYRSGLGLANAGEFEAAADPLSSAVETLRSNIARLRKFSVYSDALLKLAWTYWNIDHNYDARKGIREYAHLRPDADLDEKKYPDKLLEIYRKETEKIEKAGPGKLVIESKPEGATVWIDGREKGETPVTVEDVGYGYHYLVLQGPEGRRKAKRLRVRGRGKKQSYSMELSGGAKAKKSEQKLPAFYTQLLDAVGDGEFETSTVEPYLTELAKRTDADFATWVVMVKKEDKYLAAPFVYRVEDERLVAAERVDFSLQLSSMRVGVRELQKTIVGHLESMPGDDAVSAVALGGAADKKETGETATARAESGSGQSGSTSSKSSTSGGETRASKGSSKAVQPPPEPEKSKDGGNTMMYLGIGGGAVALGGLVAGGILLFGGSSGQPTSFSATVTW